mmetsp:Transcript_26784/g.66653  ORF Transcript_26784/g.66653 Transcript_26784/m.66653 type:complete len:209 (-) Transcript_26784:894-1520(-)
MGVASHPRGSVLRHRWTPHSQLAAFAHRPSRRRSSQFLPLYPPQQIAFPAPSGRPRPTWVRLVPGVAGGRRPLPRRPVRPQPAPPWSGRHLPAASQPACLRRRRCSPPPSAVSSSAGASLSGSWFPLRRRRLPRVLASLGQRPWSARSCPFFPSVPSSSSLVAAAPSSPSRRLPRLLRHRRRRPYSSPRRQALRHSAKSIRPARSGPQ